jgi:hypothetical protein
MQPETVAVELERSVEVAHGQCYDVNARIHSRPFVVWNGGLILPLDRAMSGVSRSGWASAFVRVFTS